MPFEIQHSGVTYASDGSEEEDAPRLRPLKLKQRHPDRTGASGRASCAYQPYVPLGGMDSVFGLKITKRGQAVACTAPAGPGPTLYPSQGDEAISEDAPMAPHAATGSVARLASSVVNERNSGHGFGYSSIRDRLSAADSIIKAVRAGQHFFDHVQPKDALESARWGTRLADEECHAAAQRGSPRRELGGAGPCTPRGTRDGGRVKTAATSVSDKAARQPQPPLEVRLEHAFAELDAKLQPSPPVARGDRRHRSRQAGRRLRQRDRDGTPDVAGPKQPHRAADARSVASGSSSAVAHASRGVPTATTKQPPSMVAASAGRSMRHIAADNISVAGTATAASTISGSTGAGGGHGGGTPPAAPSHSVRTSRLLVEQLNDVLSTPLEMPGAGPPPVPQKPPNRAPAFVHYQPKKRPYSAEAIKMAAEDMATVKHTAMTPREPPSPSTAREDLQLARSLRSARLNANAVIPVAPKLPLLDLGMQHMKHVGKLTRACKQFAASQREKRRQLHLALDTFEFERPNTFRGKFQSLESLEQSTLSMFSHEHDFRVMRTGAQKLVRLQHSVNLRRSQWLEELKAKAQEHGRDMSQAERRFIFALERMTQDGWRLTRELFYAIVRDIMPRSDLSLLSVQRLMNMVREDVLQMGVEEYRDLLMELGLPVPPDLLPGGTSPTRRSPMWAEDSTVASSTSVAPQHANRRGALFAVQSPRSMLMGMTGTAGGSVH